MVVRTLAKLAFSASDALRPPLRGPRILILHQVGAGHGYQLDMRVQDYRDHLDWLTAHTRIVTLEEALAERGSPAADRMVVLTFDDGFADMHANAFPILRERRLPFTLYLTTNPTETGTPLSDRPNSTPLSWDQVGEMAASGLMTLGAHTHLHADLRQCDADEIKSDLALCDELIETRTGVIPRHFAYPFGYWSSVADAIVRDRYDSAVLGGTRGTDVGSDDYYVFRVPVQLSDTGLFFRSKLRRGQRSEEWVRRRLTGYEGPG